MDSNKYSHSDSISINDDHQQDTSSQNHPQPMIVNIIGAATKTDPNLSDTAPLIDTQNTKSKPPPKKNTPIPTNLNPSPPAGPLKYTPLQNVVSPSEGAPSFSEPLDCNVKYRFDRFAIQVRQNPSLLNSSQLGKLYSDYKTDHSYFRFYIRYACYFHQTNHTDHAQLPSKASPFDQAWLMKLIHKLYHPVRDSSHISLKILTALYILLTLAIFASLIALFIYLVASASTPTHHPRSHIPLVPRPVTSPAVHALTSVQNTEDNYYNAVPPSSVSVSRVFPAASLPEFLAPLSPSVLQFLHPKNGTVTHILPVPMEPGSLTVQFWVRFSRNLPAGRVALFSLWSDSNGPEDSKARLEKEMQEDIGAALMVTPEAVINDALLSVEFADFPHLMVRFKHGKSVKLSGFGEKIFNSLHSRWKIHESVLVKAANLTAVSGIKNTAQDVLDNEYTDSALDLFVHLSFVIDVGGYLELFIDGISVAREFIHSNEKLFSPLRSIRIGQHFEEAFPSILGFTGEIAYFQVFSRALSSGEVRGISACSTPGSTNPLSARAKEIALKAENIVDSLENMFPNDVLDVEKSVFGDIFDMGVPGYYLIDETSLAEFKIPNKPDFVEEISKEHNAILNQQEQQSIDDGGPAAVDPDEIVILMSDLDSYTTQFFNSSSSDADSRVYSSFSGSRMLSLSSEASSSQLRPIWIGDIVIPKEHLGHGVKVGHLDSFCPLDSEGVVWPEPVWDIGILRRDAKISRYGFGYWTPPLKSMNQSSTIPGALHTTTRPHWTDIALGCPGKTEYSSWSDCSSSCDRGSQFRTRIANNNHNLTNSNNLIAQSVACAVHTDTRTCANWDCVPVPGVTRQMEQPEYRQIQSNRRLNDHRAKELFDLALNLDENHQKSYRNGIPKMLLAKRDTAAAAAMINSGGRDSRVGASFDRNNASFRDVLLLEGVFGPIFSDHGGGIPPHPSSVRRMVSKLDRIISERDGRSKRLLLSELDDYLSGLDELDRIQKEADEEEEERLRIAVHRWMDGEELKKNTYVNMGKFLAQVRFDEKVAELCALMGGHVIIGSHEHRVSRDMHESVRFGGENKGYMPESKLNKDWEALKESLSAITNTSVIKGGQGRESSVYRFSKIYDVKNDFDMHDLEAFRGLVPLKSAVCCVMGVNCGNCELDSGEHPCSVFIRDFDHDRDESLRASCCASLLSLEVKSCWQTAGEKPCAISEVNVVD